MDLNVFDRFILKKSELIFSRYRYKIDTFGSNKQTKENGTK